MRRGAWKGGGIAQAKEILEEARRNFPEDGAIAYNLACYECQLGNLDLARQRLDEARKRAGASQIDFMAKDDPDLRALWPELRRQ